MSVQILRTGLIFSVALLKWLNPVKLVFGLAAFREEYTT